MMIQRKIDKREKGDRKGAEMEQKRHRKEIREGRGNKRENR